MYDFKKLVLLVVIVAAIFFLIFGLIVHKVQAGPLTLTFGWQQDMSPGLKGWRLYMSETPGDYPADAILTILYDGNPLNEYKAITDIFSPDDESHIYYFVLTAFDDAEPDPNESGWSNEISQMIDFESPGIPFTFTVEIYPIE